MNNESMVLEEVAKMLIALIDFHNKRYIMVFIILLHAECLSSIVSHLDSCRCDALNESEIVQKNHC